MANIEDQQGARIRAARSYAKLDQGTLAKSIGVGREAVIALEADQRALSVMEARRIARVTGVPMVFLLDGWSQDLEDRMLALEAGFKKATADRDLMAAEIAELAARLEKLRLDLAAQAQQRDGQRRRASDPPRAKDPPAP